ncbi:MAG: asparagine synthase (glutamine-hydrolyzing) [Thermodesulfobacteriota bacterium]
MCGICGIFLFDQTAQIDPSVLQRMNRTMTHRGPDDQGMYVHGQVGLAMRRLSIIDLQSGHQPIANEDGSLQVVYNGEIYNYPELRADLIHRGHTFQTTSDTEVIVHLYEELGEDCVKRLNGMFSFALWDERQQKIFLARDRMGIKPLFYALDPGRRLVFGSEIKAIMPAGISRDLDYQALYDYLSLLYVPTPATAYRAIRKLPPASTLTCSANGVTIRTYWDIPLPPAGEEGIYARTSEEELQELLQRAVQRHMIADVPVGALLSSGLDSTIVTAIMRAKLGAPVKTFTIGFDRPSYDESQDARVVAQALETEHLAQVVQPGMIESIPDLLASFDEPFADYSAIPTYLVSRLAAQKVKVVLTGDGGDEIFAGYPTHVAYKVAALYRMIPQTLRRYLIDPLVMLLPTSLERISFDYRAKRFVTGADLPLEQGHYWWKVIFSEEEKQRLLSADLLKIGFRDTFEVFGKYFDIARASHPLNQLLYVDAKTFLLDDNLTKVDRMTMANSLEARVPLLDHEVVERTALISPELKVRGLQTKRLLRKAAKGLLPPEIRKSKKKGFTPPLPYWIQHELREFIEDVFSERRLTDTGLLNAEYCQGILREHLKGVRDRNREIWTIVALVCWLERQAGT